MPEQPKISVRMVSLDKPDIQDPVSTHHGGDNAHETHLSGQISELTFKHGDEDKFCLRILPTGTIILTEYGGIWSTILDRNLRLEPSRPWQTEEEK